MHQVHWKEKITAKKFESIETILFIDERQKKK